MSSTSQVVRDRFRAQFNPVLFRNSETTEGNDKDTERLVTRKRRGAITDAE